MPLAPEHRQLLGANPVSNPETKSGDSYFNSYYEWLWNTILHMVLHGLTGLAAGMARRTNLFVDSFSLSYNPIGDAGCKVRSALGITTMGRIMRVGVGQRSCPRLLPLSTCQRQRRLIILIILCGMQPQGIPN